MAVICKFQDEHGNVHNIKDYRIGGYGGLTATKSARQTISNTQDVITFDSSNGDTGDITLSNNKIKCLKNGVIEISGQVYYSGSASGRYIEVTLEENGSTICTTWSCPSNATWGFCHIPPIIRSTTKDDQYTLNVKTNTGSADLGNGYSTRLSVKYI